MFFHFYGRDVMNLRLSRTGILLVAASAALAVHGANALAWQQTPAPSTPAVPAPAAPAPTAPAADADDADAIILDRQLIMQQIDKDSMALGNIVAGTGPREKMVEHARSLAKQAKAAAKSFEAKVPGGGSKPEVWANPDDFSKRMQAFVALTEEMQKQAEADNFLVFSERLVELPCKQCHDVYRIKK